MIPMTDAEILTDLGKPRASGDDPICTSFVAPSTV